MVEFGHLWRVDQQKPGCPFWLISDDSIRCLDHVHILFILRTDWNMRGCDGDSADKTPVHNPLTVQKKVSGKPYVANTGQKALVTAMGI